MVLDYCPRGDLALFLAQKAYLNEEDARFFICEMVLAIEHLHSLDIIYRDMKPENILIGFIRFYHDFLVFKRKIAFKIKVFCLKARMDI